MGVLVLVFCGCCILLCGLALWVSAAGCVVGCSLLGCVVLVWFWVSVVVDFVWWVFGYGFCFGSGFWIPVDVVVLL